MQYRIYIRKYERMNESHNTRENPFTNSKFKFSVPLQFILEMHCAESTFPESCAKYFTRFKNLLEIYPCPNSMWNQSLDAEGSDCPTDECNRYAIGTVMVSRMMIAIRHEPNRCQIVGPSNGTNALACACPSHPTNRGTSTVQSTFFSHL